MDENVLLERLKEAGVDTDGAITRFMGNRELFLRFIRRLPQAMRFQEIRAALARQDGEEFYLLVHNLKGTAANLSAVEVADCANAILVEYNATGFLHLHKLESLVDEAAGASRALASLLREMPEEG